MRRSGFLIRFIDIGLIVLFGFLVISDIDVFSQIDMPSSEEESSSSQNQIVFVSVQVFEDGKYTASLTESGDTFCSRVEKKEIESCITEIKRNYEGSSETPIILIEPNDKSIVQNTIDLLDICERVGILKNINVSELEI